MFSAPKVPLLAPSPVRFPNPRQALSQPDGLLAAGGGLAPEWLLEAYARGVFPWFNSDDEQILWWCPSNRAVILPGEMRIPRSLLKRIRNGGFTLSMDRAFDAVVAACGGPRRDASGTWITPNMAAAYTALFVRGYAHSVEVWRDDQLVGGLYGVSLGATFFGESMFSHERDASKVAFYWLQSQLKAWEFLLIDCQIMNPHLETLGVSEIHRDLFLEVLKENARLPTRQGRWRFDEPLATLEGCKMNIQQTERPRSSF